MSADTIQNQAPLFIVFDGMDGTGKTTQMRLLCERLNSLGMETVVTCEPSTSPDGRALRRALSGKEPANNSRMAALFLIDRIGHNAEIEGWLAEGKTVICDRYYYASMAYQGQGDCFEWVADIAVPLVGGVPQNQNLQLPNNVFPNDHSRRDSDRTLRRNCRGNR